MLFVATPWMLYAALTAQTSFFFFFYEVKNISQIILQEYVFFHTKKYCT